MNKKIIMCISLLSALPALNAMSSATVRQKQQAAEKYIQEGKMQDAQRIIQELRTAKQNRIADSLELMLKPTTTIITQIDKNAEEALKRSELVRSNMNNRINQLINAQERGTLEKTQLTTELANYKKEQQEMLNDISNLTKDLQASALLLKEAQKKDLEKSNELEKLDQELSTCKTKELALEKEKDGHIDTINKLKQIVEASSQSDPATIVNLKKQLQEARSQLVKENETIAKLQVELTETQALLKKAEQEKNTLPQDKSTEQGSLYKELYELKEKYKVIERDNAALKHENGTLKTERDKARELLAAMNI